MEFRLASAADSAAVLAVYAQYIGTSVTFETELPPPAAFAARIEGIAAEYPYILAFDGEALAGYAYAHAFGTRAAYRWCAELSVYTAAGFGRRGLGGRLYSALCDILALQNIRTACGVIALPNDASERLHASQGFVRCGEMPFAGWKAGDWHPVCWYAKQLPAAAREPGPFIPVGSLPPEAVAAVLKKYERILKPRGAFF